MAELQGGAAFVYTPGLVFLNAIPAPVANTTITGIAYNPADNMLYWSLLINPTTNHLWRTTVAGATPTFMGPLAIPGPGIVAGMDFDNNNVLWVNDGTNAQYSDHNPATGAWIGNVLCGNPGGVGALGFGITFRGISAAGNVFEVPNGTAAAGQVTQISPMTMPGCNVTGGSINVFAPGIIVLGVEFDNVGSTNVPSIYVYESTTNTITELAANQLFIRGDCDTNGIIGIVDALNILNFLFGGIPINCALACDADSSGSLSIVDALFVLNFLFTGGAPPGPPFPRCGADPTGSNLTCTSYAGCP